MIYDCHKLLSDLKHYIGYNIIVTKLTNKILNRSYFKIKIFFCYCKHMLHVFDVLKNTYNGLNNLMCLKPDFIFFLLNDQLTVNLKYYYFFKK